MNILVTVGSTPFPSLMKAADALAAKHPAFTVRCQTAEPDLTLVHAESFAWTESIVDDYQQADLIICHAGAGTVYALLEMNKKIVVVPNLERADHHQLELTDYVAQQGYAVACHSLLELESAVFSAIEQKNTPYNKEPFFLANNLVQYFGL